MECPICYCSQASRKLACGHSFCMSCVKEWYVKCASNSEPSCPMCRKNIHFRGINSMIEEWENEHREIMFQHVFEERLDQLLEDVDMFTMLFLKHISERFQKIRQYDFYLTEEDIDYLIFNRYEIFTYPSEIRDIPTWKILMDNCVSKHAPHANKKSRGSKKRGYTDYPESFIICILV